MNLLESHKLAIHALCKNHKVLHLYAFGSILTDQFDSSSDIDLIVEFRTINVEDYADNYFDLKFSLQDILKRPIDLLEEKAIRNPYFKEIISQQRRLIYAA